MFNRFKKNIFYLGLLGLVVWFFWDGLKGVWSSGQDISRVSFSAFALMLIFECLSFLCVWWMFKCVLPSASWSKIGVSQLVANAASRVIPGGAATGSAVQMRMLTSTGAKTREVGGAFAATSVLAMAVLMFIPAIAGLVTLMDTSVEGNLLWATIVGPVLLVFLISFCLLVIKFDAPLVFLAKFADRALGFCFGMFSKSWVVNPMRLVEEKNRLVSTLRTTWRSAILAAAGKWFFDCLVLFVALNSVGAEIALGALLLAYSGASVLAMVPITPGGFGFVEVGLSNMLETSGVGADDADLAVFVYRLVSFCFPIALGVLAAGFYKMFLVKTSSD